MNRFRGPSFCRPGCTGLPCIAIALLSVALTGVRPSNASTTDSGPAFQADSLSAQAVSFALRYDALPTPADTPDRWWARDKARHVVFSGLWTLSTQYVLVSKADWSEGDALPLSVASAASVGLAKELYDAQSDGGTMSAKDLVADAVGICFAAGVIVL